MDTILGPWWWCRYHHDGNGDHDHLSWGWWWVWHACHKKKEHQLATILWSVDDYDVVVDDEDDHKSSF